MSIIPIQRTLFHAFIFAGLIFATQIPRISAAAPGVEISEKFGSQIGPITPLINAQNYDEALNRLGAIEPTLEPESYDQLVLNQLKAQILITQGKLIPAIAPLEIVAKIDAGHDYLDATNRTEIRYYLAQLYYQDAIGKKLPGAQKSAYEKALSYARLWQHDTPRLSGEGADFLCSLFYNCATIDPGNVDKDLLKEAITAANAGLRQNITVQDQLRLIIIAAEQQLGNEETAAEQLELLVSERPENQTYWSQLAGIYLNLSGVTTDSHKQRHWILRAIVSIERAQRLGLLSSPKEQLNLIGLYFNLGEYDRASKLLNDGLATGKVENTSRNWELLASARQQLKDNDGAVKVLSRAVEQFPEEGRLELALSQLYYAQENIPAAYQHALVATAKPALENPGGALTFLAYLAYESKDYSVAADALNRAAKQPDAKADEIERLKTAVQEAIKASASTS